MKDKSKDGKTEAFDHMMRSLSAAIKNSALYSPGHPSLANSMRSFYEDLQLWFTSSDKLDLGVSPDNLLANGEYIRKEGSDLYAEVGSYLHQHGLISVTFIRGIDEAELERFFNAIRSDPKRCAETGGIAKDLPRSEHLALREIDYSALLKKGSGSGTAKPQTDKDIWQSLVSLSAGPAGELPVSKAEFLESFLHSPEKSAAVLDRVYKEARAKVDHKTTVRKMRAALAGVARYFQGQGEAGPRDVKKNIIDIILKLDPDLIARLFEEDRDGGETDLSDELLRSMPDDAVADFIASLVGKEGGVNTPFIKLFDKLVSDSSRSSNVGTLVGDKLFNMASADKGLITRLQGSFKDMLTSNPDSGFLNQIYKMTIDTFADSGISQVPRSDEYMRMARDTAEALKDDSLRRQEFRMLLNLIWLERSPDQFKKLCDIFKNKFDAILDLLSIRVLREAYELFTSGIEASVKTDPGFGDHISSVLDLMTADQTLIKVMAIIRESGPVAANDISRILLMAGPNSARLITDAYVLETDGLAREKISRVITSMGVDVLKELVQRIELSDGIDPEVRAGLLGMVSSIDPQKARGLSVSMLKNRDPGVMKQAIDIFTIKDREDAAMLLGLLEQKIPDDIGKKIVRKMLESKDADFINILFRTVGHGRLAKQYLQDAVKLCGDIKLKESLGHLRRIFMTKPLFYTRFTDSIRVASVVSLAQIGTEEAMVLVKGGLSDRSNAVRRMSGIILELGKGDKAS